MMFLVENLKKDKKKEVQEFENSVRELIRELPKSLVSYREDELVEFLKTEREKIDAEYVANTNVVKTFKNTQHLTITPKTAAPAASTSSDAGGSE